MCAVHYATAEPAPCARRSQHIGEFPRVSKLCDAEVPVLPVHDAQGDGAAIGSRVVHVIAALDLDAGGPGARNPCRKARRDLRSAN